jgi:hypothetical protein
MAGASVVKRARTWCGWWLGAGLILLSLPVLADEPKNTPPGSVLQLGMEPVHQRVMGVAWQAGARVAEAYERSPVMVMGLGLAATLPWLATFVAIMRAVRRRAARRNVDAHPVLDPAPLAAKAWIDIGEGAGRVPLAFTGEILRIGRHSDNDIALEHNAVHRHHALIQRTPDDEFVLMDLTAGTGNETLLNGRPAARAALKDGDRIVLGDTMLTFHLGVEAPAASVRAEARKPITPSAREITDDERDAGDEPAEWGTDGIATRRIGPLKRLAARSAHRSRA